MRAKTLGLSQSVHTRLVQHAQALGVDVNLVLTRFATERLLYRLSRSPHTERFVLKGALLMLVWLGETIRPTRDADLLGFGDLTLDSQAAPESVCGHFGGSACPSASVSAPGLYMLLGDAGASLDILPLPDIAVRRHRPPGERSYPGWRRPD